jgi:hypothetical protein
MRRRTLVLSMALVSALFAGPGAGAAGAETCDGTIGGDRELDSLVVPDRGDCTIGPNADVTVAGGVDLGEDARLWVRRGTEGARGTLRARGEMSLGQGSTFLSGGKLTLLGRMIGRPDKVGLIDDTFIGGRVTLTAVAKSVELEDVSIDGDLEIGSGRGGTLLTRVHVDGDVSVRDKRFGSIGVFDSTMDRLVVVDNIVTSITIRDNIIAKQFACLRNQSANSFASGNVVVGVTRADSCVGRASQ